MSGCPAFQDLNGLLDGDLPGEQELALRQHLDLCADCRRRLNGLTALKGSVGRVYDGNVPSPALRRAVTAGVAKRRRRRWWWAGAIAAPILLVAGAQLVGWLHPPETSSLAAAVYDRGGERPR